MKLQELVGTDLRAFSALLKLCRKQGVAELKIGDVSVRFGDLPPRKVGEAEEPADPQTPDEPTLEQLAFMSAGGVIPGLMP